MTTTAEVMSGDSHVRRLVTGPAVSLRREQSLMEAAEVLATNDIGAALVKSGNDTIGVISERDIVKACTAEVDELAELRVADVMSSEVETIEGAASVLDAAQRMLDGGIRHLAVVDGAAPVGLISIRDLFAVLVRSSG